MDAEWEKPIAEAIAAKLLALDGIRQTVPLGSDNLTMLPGALVMTPRLELLERTGSHEAWRATYPCLVVVKVTKTDRALEALASFAGKIRIAWRAGIKLGLVYVQDSWVAGFDPELVQLAGADHPAYAFDIVTLVRETLTATRTA